MQALRSDSGRGSQVKQGRLQPRRLLRRASSPLGLTLTLLLSAGAQAGEQCASSMAQSIRNVQNALDTLRSGSNDGAKYPPNQARWMQEELRMISEACARGSELEAAWRLEQIQDRMAAPRKPIAGTGTCQATSSAELSCALSADARIGRRTVNVEPIPSRLSTNTSP
jgi:hypothetical protein